MADTDKPRQKVISYIVNFNGPVGDYSKVAEAISEGYRVVDILKVPAGAGSAASGFVAVTVFLHWAKEDGAVHYAGFKKA